MKRKSHSGRQKLLKKLNLQRGRRGERGWYSSEEEEEEEETADEEEQVILPVPKSNPPIKPTSTTESAFGLLVSSLLSTARPVIKPTAAIPTTRVTSTTTTTATQPVTKDIPPINDTAAADDPFLLRFGPLATPLATSQPSLQKQSPHNLTPLPWTVTREYNDIVPSNNNNKPPPLTPKLDMAWRKYIELKRNPIPRSIHNLTPLQTLLMPTIMYEYRDVVFSDRTLANSCELRELYVLHALNHALKARALVLKNDKILKKVALRSRIAGNAKRALNQQREKSSDDDDEDNDDSDVQDTLQSLIHAGEVEDEDKFRDQGFTRPRVLIVVPYRNTAARVINLIIELVANASGTSGVQIHNLDRFHTDYCGGATEMASQSFDETDLELGTHPCLSGNVESGKTPRPKDWYESFEGDADEAFGMGIGLPGSRGNFLKLCCDYSRSDIIVASPLGLRLATNQAVGVAATSSSSTTNANNPLLPAAVLEEEEENQDQLPPTTTNVDFLSSIEILILDRADVYHTQNWTHVEDMVVALNQRASSRIRRDIDFARLAPRFLDNQASLYRQTLIFSAYPDALLNSLSRRLCSNFAGVARFRRTTYPPPPAAAVSIPQRYRRVLTDTAGRLGWFESNILPGLLLVGKEDVVMGTLVYVPSYFDFVRVCDVLKRRVADAGLQEDDIFVGLSEYSTPAQVSRARRAFFHHQVRILLITERFHYYFRYHIRGVKRILFYGPPARSHFLDEILGFCNTDTATEDRCVVLYGTEDALQLERVVGTTRAKMMLKQGEGKDFVIC